MTDAGPDANTRPPLMNHGTTVFLQPTKISLPHAFTHRQITNNVLSLHAMSHRRDTKYYWQSTYLWPSNFIIVFCTKHQAPLLCVNDFQRGHDPTRLLLVSKWRMYSLGWWNGAIQNCVLNPRYLQPLLVLHSGPIFCANQNWSSVSIANTNRRERKIFKTFTIMGEDNKKITFLDHRLNHSRFLQRLCSAPHFHCTSNELVVSNRD